MNNVLFILGLMVAGFAISAEGAPHVPESLKPWVPWVMEQHAPTANCPHEYTALEQRACIWHMPARFVVRGGAATFEWEARTFGETEVPLPGDLSHWPVDVTVNGDARAALARAGRPYLRLPVGTHRLRGEIRFDSAPDRIAVPDDLGLIELEVNGVQIRQIRRDARGLLLAPAPSDDAEPGTRDAMAVRVFRRIDDDVPLRLTTRVELDVAGRAREVRLGPALLDGFVPLQLTSALPARIEQDATLRVQVKPGTHVIDIVSRDTLGQAALERPASTGHWPETEIWSVATDPDLRNLRLEADTPTDPTRVGAPDAWAQLPAFVMGPGARLALIPVAAEPGATPADAVQLERTIWLDEQGAGWLAKDVISGELRRARRLATQPEMVLGRATVNGEDRLITLHQDDTRAVPVTAGPIAMQTVSRLNAERSFATTGWRMDFDAVHALLRLPPGWSLITARGVDRAPHSWVEQWNLLDIFVVLVIAAAFARLFGWPAGVLALVTMTLAYPYDGSPKVLWLLALVGVALTRHLPTGRIQQGARWVRNGAMVGVALVCLPWFATLLLHAVYPQLEGSQPPALSAADHGPHPRFGASVDAKVEMLHSLPPARHAAAIDDALLGSIEPAPQWDAKIQTGPGIPEWSGRVARLEWSGPVTAEETVHLVLAPPWVTRPGKVIVVLLVTLLFAVLVRGQRLHAGAFTLRRQSAAGLVLAAVLAGTLPEAGASTGPFPEPSLLEELERRLTRPPPCLPDCAVISAAQLRIANDTLELTFTAEAGAHMAIPLLGGAEGWTPSLVTVGGAPAAVRTTAEGTLHVRTPAGRSEIRLTGPVVGDALSLRFGLAPAYLTVEAPGWTAVGLDGRRLRSDELTLSRARSVAASDADAQLQPDPVPVFARIERRVVLDRQWRVLTQVIRVAPHQGGITLEVPLLPGESVLTEELTVNEGRAGVYLGPDQKRVQWESALSQSDSLVLRAPADAPWSEQWTLTSDPRWEIAWSGLEPSAHQSDRGGLRWRPRPGDAVTVSIQEPPAAPGPTTSIDRAQLDLDTGARATQATLTLAVRASIGGTMAIPLPEGAQLESLTINGVRHAPVVEQGRARAPLVPGAQSLVLDFRLPSTGGLWQSSPAFSLPDEAANLHLRWQVPRDRWILFTAGPLQGPAVLFWGVALLALSIALGLGRFYAHPTMRTRDWVLLAIGMTGAGSAVAALLVVAWFVVFAQRQQWAPSATPRFNLGQVGLALLTGLFLTSLLVSVPMGLLGQPDMHIAGNGSTAHSLNWYAADADAGAFPKASVISLPLWVYRLLMLLWSLWLATALMRWLSWGWSTFSHGGLWKPRVILPKGTDRPA